MVPFTRFIFKSVTFILLPLIVAYGVVSIASPDDSQTLRDEWRGAVRSQFPLPEDAVIVRIELTATPRWIGVNCTMGVSRAQTLFGMIDQAHRVLMYSPEHRRNIMHRSHREVAFGFAVKYNRMWVVQVFIAPWPDERAPTCSTTSHASVIISLRSNQSDGEIHAQLRN